MPCTEWKELLVARLYGDIDPQDSERLSRHLEACANCSGELEELAATRYTLRTSAPAVPPAPRVVLLTPAPSRLSFLALAAGLAGIGVLAGMAAAWAWQARDSAARIASTGPTQPVPAVQAVSRDEMEKWFEARLARLESEKALGSGSAQEPTPAQRPLTRSDVEAMLTRMARRIDRDRAADIDYLLREMTAAEARTGLRLGETQNAVRYLAMASDPRMSER